MNGNKIYINPFHYWVHTCRIRLQEEDDVMEYLQVNWADKPYIC